MGGGVRCWEVLGIMVGRLVCAGGQVAHPFHLYTVGFPQGGFNKEAGISTGFDRVTYNEGRKWKFS